MTLTLCGLQRRMLANLQAAAWRRQSGLLGSACLAVQDSVLLIFLVVKGCCCGIALQEVGESSLGGDWIHDSSGPFAPELEILLADLGCPGDVVARGCAATADTQEKEECQGDC